MARARARGVPRGHGGATAMLAGHASTESLANKAPASNAHQRGQNVVISVWRQAATSCAQVVRISQRRTALKGAGAGMAVFRQGRIVTEGRALLPEEHALLLRIEAAAQQRLRDG
eukprot:57592-Pleurochrysis_carterae.AAC.1